MRDNELRYFFFFFNRGSTRSEGLARRSIQEISEKIKRMRSARDIYDEIEVLAFFVLHLTYT